MSDRKTDLEAKKAAVATKIAALVAKYKAVQGSKKPDVEAKLARIAAKIEAAKKTIARCDAEIAKVPAK